MLERHRRHKWWCYSLSPTGPIQPSPSPAVAAFSPSVIHLFVSPPFLAAAIAIKGKPLRGLAVLAAPAMSRPWSPLPRRRRLSHPLSSPTPFLLFGRSDPSHLFFGFGLLDLPCIEPHLIWFKPSPKKREREYNFIDFLVRQLWLLDRHIRLIHMLPPWTM